MPAPYLGGLEITGVEWLDSHALKVRFETTWGAQFVYQLYAGRTRIGESSSPAARSVIGLLQSSRYPQHLALLAVEPSQRLTDYGPLLPPRPYNRVRLSFPFTDSAGDAKFLDVFAGTTPGGAVDLSNRIGRLLYDADRTYQFLTKPLDGTGQWNFQVRPTDDKPADGNAGTGVTGSASVLAHPPDVELQNGARLSVSVASGTATISFVRPA